MDFFFSSGELSAKNNDYFPKIYESEIPAKCYFKKTEFHGSEFHTPFLFIDAAGVFWGGETRPWSLGACILSILWIFIDFIVH